MQLQSKTKNLSYLLALALSAGGAAANADSLNGSGAWQSWTANSPVVDSNSAGGGTPYWNNASGDGPKENVGWCLTGGGACTMAAAAPGAVPYYGNGSGAASSMYFTGTANPVTVSLQTVLTTQTTTGGGYDVVGYYLAGSSGKAPSAAALNPLFDSRTSTAGTAATLGTLAMGQNYGFYIENIQGNGTPFATDYFYFMDSTSNTATGSMPADALQHFATFNAGNGIYFLGDVDGDACSGSFQPGTSPCVPSSQFDYNNLMLEVVTSAASSTPEPASLTLIGGALLAMAAVVRRKRNRTFEKTAEN